MKTYSIIEVFCYLIGVIVSMAELSLSHDKIDAYFWAFTLTGCSLGILSSLRDDIINKLKP